MQWLLSYGIDCSLAHRLKSCFFFGFCPLLLRERKLLWSLGLGFQPNGKWRFCIDFRPLNKTITDVGWPLPRINELLERLGNSGAIIFGKIDLTNGYHQMPLSESVKQYTAFRVHKCLYEWEQQRFCNGKEKLLPTKKS